MKKTLLLPLLLCVAACQPTIANRGDILDPDSLASIKPGVSTREQVATTLGTPTEIGTFDDKDWYYVGRQTRQYSFLDPEVIKQQAVEVSFDDKGVVTAVRKLDLSKAGDVKAVEETTPTYGNDHTFLRQLLGDLSHPMPDLSDPRERNGP